MSAKDRVVEYLQDEPRFRERSNKDQGIVNLLMRKYPSLRAAVDAGIITKTAIIELVQDYATYDRAWRQALEHDPSLRGTDYDDKAKLEQEAQLRLGYTPGHYKDVKKLRTL